MSVDRRPELQTGKVIGIVNPDGGVLSVLVKEHMKDFLIDIGFVSDLIWLDAGDYLTAIQPGKTVQLPLPKMKKPILEIINYRKKNKGNYYTKAGDFKDLANFKQLPLEGIE